MNFFHSFSIQMQQKPLVHTAANLFREMCYKYRDSLMAGIIVAGWDEKKGGQVQYVDICETYVLNSKGVVNSVNERNWFILFSSIVSSATQL